MDITIDSCNDVTILRLQGKFIAGRDGPLCREKVKELIDPLGIAYEFCMERYMKCGVGKCGHCQMNHVYTCQDGPCFSYAEIKHLEEAL